MNPFITVVYNDYKWRLLVIIENDVYYSEPGKHHELIRFKKYTEIEIHDNAIVLHTKNNMIVLNKR
jgi:hypothetical protein